MSKQTQLQQLAVLMMLLLVLPVAFNSVSAVYTIQACGSQLSDVLFGVCQGRFETFRYQKRGSLDLFDYVEHQQQDEISNGIDGDEIGLGWPQNSIMATRRLPRGVVDECCRKPCVYMTIRKYCSN
ncbi:GH16013 [Drosophila grimshawi]|uniref:GH16013 n=2 Tax=Drosophila grimshawi TaxID=7222 RepID=B4J2G4_DROGR|nr:GH16013 [Drosophila grimshawi]